MSGQLPPGPTPAQALAFVTGTPGGFIWSYAQRFYHVSEPNPAQLAAVHHVLGKLEEDGKICSDRKPMPWTWWPT